MSAFSGDMKQYLDQWSHTQGGTSAECTFQQTGPRFKQRWMCSTKLKNYDFIGVGVGRSKKLAQGIAVKEFLVYLVRRGLMEATEVEKFGIVHRPTPSTVETVLPDALPEADVLPECNNAEKQEASSGSPEKVKPDLDLTARDNGNWTIGNAKLRLDEFFHENKIRKNYKYRWDGPEDNRVCVAELKVYIKKLKQTVCAHGRGANELISSKSCALSLVRQLYHVGIIEPNTGSFEDSEEILPYEVAMSDELSLALIGIVNDLELETADEPALGETVSLVRQQERECSKNTENTNDSCVISWSPPQAHCNAWTGFSLDKGALTEVEMQHVSDDLKETFSKQAQISSEITQQIIIEREKLPIYKLQEEVLHAVSSNPVVIIEGPTGCGKTTQIPQYILDSYIQSGHGAECNIMVIQPRRISVVCAAERVAAERGEDLGLSTGYSVCFESVLPRSYGGILYCTSDAFLRKLEAGLKGISHVIVDDIQEHDLNTDFAMIILRDIVMAHPQMRLILMSSAANTNMFSNYFNNCPVVQIPRKLHPVQVYYLEDCIEALNFKPPQRIFKMKFEDYKHFMDEVEPELEDYGNLGQRYSESTRATLAQLREKDLLIFELLEELLKYIKGLNVPGSVLIFLPESGVVASFLKLFQNHPVWGSDPSYVVVPLHAEINQQERLAVFQTVPSGVTKVILSTEVAEIGITINDVVHVIDFCKTRLNEFSLYGNVSGQAVEWASKSNLKRRRVQAGQMCPGYAFHICSKARFEKLQEQRVPEILCHPLQEVFLISKLIGLVNVAGYLAKAVQIPPSDAVIEAELMLTEIGALDKMGELTPLGKVLARLPVEPHIGKMLILGCIFNCADAICIIASQTSAFPCLFLTTIESRKVATQRRRYAGYRYGDHMAILNIFQSWEKNS